MMGLFANIEAMVFELQTARHRLTLPASWQNIGAGLERLLLYVCDHCNGRPLLI